MRDKAWLSILGLYKYDNTIFDDMRLPAASDLDLTLPYMQTVVEDLSKDTLVFKILMDLAELPLVYTDPETVKYMITRWSLARTPVWRELWKTTLYKYVPVWNKDGVIEETRSLETTGTSSGTVEDKTASGHTITGTLSKTTTTDQDTTDTKSGTDKKTVVVDESTAGTTSGKRDVETVTDQDTTESKTTTTSSTTTTDQDTSKAGSSSGSGSLNRTIAHNVTGFDTDQYAPDTQDVTTETTSTTGQTSETGTNDVTETVSGTVTESGSRTNDVTETIDETTSGTTSGTRDVEETHNGQFSETGSGTNDIETIETGTTGETMSGTGSLDRETSGETAGTEDETIRRVEQGNIGITTTQQMIREQREIVLLDMYQVITDEFKKQFCIMVY